MAIRRRSRSHSSIRYDDGPIPADYAEHRRAGRERASRVIAWAAIAFAVLAFASHLPFGRLF